MGNRFWARVQKQPGFWKQLQEAVESAQLIASAKGWFPVVELIADSGSLRAIPAPEESTPPATEKQAACLGVVIGARR